MSCCGCNNSPCICVPACLESCPEIVDYEASNINLAGIGVYDSQSGNEFQFRGIRSTDGEITVTLNDTFHTIDLTITDLAAVGTKVFTNAANRALDIPAFNGQLGVQTDTDVIYYATGTSAGNWATDFTFLSGKTTTMATGTIVQIANAGTVTVISPTSNSNWDFENMDVNFDNSDITLESDAGFQVDGVVTVGDASSGTGTVNFLQDSTLTVNGVSTFDTLSLVTFNGTPEANAGLVINAGDLRLNSGARLDFQTGSLLQVGGASVTANSVLVTSTAGTVASKLIAQFISTDNTQTGYTAFTNPVTRRTCDTTTVTLPQLAELVGTLISDLKLSKHPAT